jgi:hypothetical protein
MPRYPCALFFSGIEIVALALPANAQTCGANAKDEAHSLNRQIAIA